MTQQITISDSAISYTITNPFQIPEKFSGVRLDKALSELFPSYSRVSLSRLIQAGSCCVNGHIVLKPKTSLLGGEIISLTQLPDQIISEFQNAQQWLSGPDSQNDESSIQIREHIIFEDQDLIIINKPAGLVVHPAPGHPGGTLMNSLLIYYPELAGLPRAGLVHRLDKDTTGLLIVAKTLPAYTGLIRQLQAREITRIYWAIVQGRVVGPGSIIAPLGRDPRNRQKISVRENGGGREAITHYRPIRQLSDKLCLLEVQLETGRTHQIRVHLLHKYLPILGDLVYSGRFLNRFSDQINRQALHARYLRLVHPISRIAHEFEAPLPADFENVLDFIQNPR